MFSPSFLETKKKTHESRYPFPGTKKKNSHPGAHLFHQQQLESIPECQPPSQEIAGLKKALLGDDGG